ncbi:MAG: DUF2461 domain-containing protein [FCB group bacterium]|nr:DUF2461 domain-containing protein [FCB group bacterium]
MFKGFSRDYITFFKKLRKKNDKQWFKSHKQDYENLLLIPLKNLVIDVGNFMLSIDSEFEIRPMINRTISKIYRDTRFSRDKSLFKTSLWITFKRPQKNWKDAPAYFFEISPYSYRFGMGFYKATPKTMEKFRELIDKKPKEFQKAISFYRKQNIFVLEGEKYKRIFDKTKPAEIQNWYQRKNFYLVCNRKIDSALFSKKLADDLISGFNSLANFYHFLLKVS